MNNDTRHKLLLATYIMVLFYALHYTIPYFILSKFLSNYFSISTISLIFVFSGVVTILSSNFLSLFLKKYKDYKTLMSLSVFQMGISLLMPFIGDISPFILMIIFSLYMASGAMIWACISIFMEEFSPVDETGSIRGLSLTIYNFGVLISPFIAANILSNYSYIGIFVISSLTILPIMFFAREYLRHVKEPKYKHKNILEVLKKAKDNSDLKGVLISSFILNSFYAAMNVYFILYLLNDIKISSITYLSVIVPIFIIPFILIPYELGKVSDEYFGEKRFMILGILIFSCVMISIYVFNINTNSVFFWTLILLISRIGATINETENYTYFYKKIDAENADLIAIFQNMVNISLVFVSILGFILIKLFNASIPFLLFVVGILGILSIFKIIQIHDTKTKKDININIEIKQN